MRYQEEIDATHPMVDFESPSSERESMNADALAMYLVGERHGKRDLVDLVRWLLISMDDEIRSSIGLNIDLSNKEGDK